MVNNILIIGIVSTLVIFVLYGTFDMLRQINKLKDKE